MVGVSPLSAVRPSFPMTPGDDRWLRDSGHDLEEERAGPVGLPREV